MALLPIPASPADWHALRRRHVGASEVAVLFGAQPDYMPGIFALWQVKAERIPPEPVENERVRWGLLLEDAIAAGAAEREGWEVLPGQYASHPCGLGATLDRIIAKPGENDSGCEGPGVLELKNADWLVHRRTWGDEPPLHILLQLQAQLLATGYTWGAVAVLVGGNDLRIYRYRARPAIQAEMERRVAAFWSSVRADQAPAVDGSDATFRALIQIAPPADEERDLSEDDEAPDLCAAYVTAQAEAKAAQKRQAEARNRLVEKLAGGWARIPGFGLSLAVTCAKPDREAVPGEIIKGRAESVRLIVREHAE